jgi:hypothetical protein
MGPPLGPSREAHYSESHPHLQSIANWVSPVIAAIYALTAKRAQLHANFTSEHELLRGHEGHTNTSPKVEAHFGYLVLFLFQEEHEYGCGHAVRHAARDPPGGHLGRELRNRISARIVRGQSLLKVLIPPPIFVRR